MREFEFEIKEDLKRGLRRLGERRHRTEGLVECFNWMPERVGLKVHDVISDVTSTDSFLLVSTGNYVITESGDKIRLI